MSQTTASDAYRRKARRLRARLGHDRLRLYRSLRELNNASPARSNRPVQAGPAARFARLVAQSIDGSVIRYSQRLALLRHADRLGIERFEANLVIAAVQHQLHQQEAPLRETDHTPGRLATILGNSLLFVLIQSVIVAIAWTLVRA